MAVNKMNNEVVYENIIINIFYDYHEKVKYIKFQNAIYF